MRINSINAGTRLHSYSHNRNTRKNVSAVSFNGKHDYAKAGAGIFGALGTIGATAGLAIMTGGIGTAVLPLILGYGATCAGGGAFLGHQVDKDMNKKEKDGNNDAK